MIFVNGLKRSGNHVIIDWMANNLDMEHINWVNGRNQHYAYSEDNINNISYEEGYIYSFEDITYAQFSKYIPDNSIKIYIHRSIDNMIASRIIAFTGNEKTARPAFVDYADKLQTGKFSEELIELDAKLIAESIKYKYKYDMNILYDEFISSKKYRNKILKNIRSKLNRGNLYKKLMLYIRTKPERTDSLRNVSNHGFGNSFLRQGQRETEVARYKQRLGELSDEQKEVHRKIVEIVNRAAEN